MENKRHLNHIESLRAIAAISVSIFHFSAYFNWEEGTSERFKFGAQGVEIFYMISGFIIVYSLYHSNYLIKHYLNYMSKRLIRLLPPFILTIIGIECMDFILSKVAFASDYQLNFKEVLVNIFFLADLFPNIEWINPIFATLEVELQFYLLIGLLFPLFRKYPISFPILSLLILGLGYLTLAIDTFLVNSPYFIIGMSLFFTREKGLKMVYLLPLVAAFASLITFYYWEDFIVAIIGLTAIYFLPSNTNFLKLSGKISYSYYLLHGLTGGWFLYFFSGQEIAMAYPWLAILAAIGISWSFAFVLYWIIERPSIRISKRIKYNPTDT